MTVTELVAQLRIAGAVFAEEEAELIATQAADDGERSRWLARRVAGEPLEQILGWAEFDGLRIVLEPGVFVPRQRTVALVDEAEHLLAAHSQSMPTVVDLCCGSGAVGLALAIRRPIELIATDIDEVAVRCAARNLGDRGRVYTGDLTEAVPEQLRGRVAILLANAPYVPTDAIALMPPEARDFEPVTALDGGSDGLDHHHRIAALAFEWLVPGGHVVIETSQRQAAGTVGVMRDAGLSARIVRDDRRDATVVVATAGASPGLAPDSAEQGP